MRAAPHIQCIVLARVHIKESIERSLALHQMYLESNGTSEESETRDQLMTIWSRQVAAPGAQIGQLPSRKSRYLPMQGYAGGLCRGAILRSMLSLFYMNSC